MSTLIYSVREDHPQQAGRSEQDRRRVNLVIILVAVAMGPGVFLLDRLVGAVTWRSFLAEALSLCLYAAVAVWYALRGHTRTAWHVAGMVYLVGLAITGLVGVFTRQGLSTLLVDSPRANEPILLAGVVMLLFLPLIGVGARRFPTDANRISLGPAYPRSRLGLYILVSAATDLLIGFHFWLTAKMAGVDGVDGAKPACERTKAKHELGRANAV